MSVYLNEGELVRSITDESFFEFLKEFWDVLNEEEPPVWNWHIPYLCRIYQREVERIHARQPHKRDIIINIAPGTTKSSVFSIFGPAWAWSKYPYMRFLNASHTAPLALDLASRCRTVVESEKYQDTYPHVRLKPEQNAKSMFETTKGGYRYSVGTREKPTGMHAHLITVDDPIDPVQVLQEAFRNQVNHFMRKTLPTRKVNKNVSGMILVMQRLGQADPTGERLDRDEDGVFHICLPAECRTKPELVKPAHLRRKYKDGLMDPLRIPNSQLKKQENALGTAAYAAQFLQDPAGGEGMMFHPDKIEILADLPQREPRKVVRYWDKAGTQDGGCYTVGVKMARYDIPSEYRLTDEQKEFEVNCFYVILDVVRVQLAPGRREKLIKQTASLDGRKVVVGLEQEPGSSGKEVAEFTARNLAGFSVRLDKPTGEKAVRAGPFASMVNAGGVQMLLGQWSDAYIDELRHFPESTYKDQVDASSGAFSMLVKIKTKVGVF